MNALQVKEKVQKEINHEDVKEFFLLRRIEELESIVTKLEADLNAQFFEGEEKIYFQSLNKIYLHFEYIDNMFLKLEYLIGSAYQALLNKINEEIILLENKILRLNELYHFQ